MEINRFIYPHIIHFTDGFRCWRFTGRYLDYY